MALKKSTESAKTEETANTASTANTAKTSKTANTASTAKTSKTAKTAKTSKSSKSSKTSKTEEKPKKKPARKKVQETGNEYLEYKGKKLVRVGNVIYYGNVDDPYIATFRLEDNEELGDITVSKRVIIELKTNEGKASKLMRQAERDGLYKAFDIGMFWLDQALEMSKK